MSWGPNSTVESYAVDGITTVWVTTIPFVNPAWLKCYQSDGATFMNDVTSLAAITAATDPATGGVVLIAPALAAVNGSTLIFRMEIPIAQTAISLGPNDELPSESAVSAWDLAIMLIAMLGEALDRCVSQAEWVGPNGPVLPAAQLGAVLGWGAGNTLVNMMTATGPALPTPQAGTLLGWVGSALANVNAAPVTLKGTLTLAANATSTVVSTGSATQCTASSVINVQPLPGGIAGDIASGDFSIVAGAGSFTVTHPSNPSATRTAKYTLSTGNVGSFTLNANASSTTVSTGIAANCLATSVINVQPRPGGIAGDIASGDFSVVAGVGQFVVYHPNNPSATRVANYTLTV